MRSELAVTGGVTAVLALSATLAISPPASASISDCPDHRACGWINSHYQNPIGWWSSSTSYLAGFNDKISSMLNTKSRTIGWYENAGYMGDVFVQNPNEGGYFNFLDPRNDTFSSVFVYAT